VRIPGKGFACKKTSRGRISYYWVKSYRSGKTIKRRVVAYMGPSRTIEGALAWFKKEARRLRQSMGTSSSPAGVDRIKAKIAEAKQRSRTLMNLQASIRMNELRTKRRLRDLVYCQEVVSAKDLEQVKAICRPEPGSLLAEAIEHRKENLKLSKWLRVKSDFPRAGRSHYKPRFRR